ncbi:DUF4158 domain-containing protein [Pseudovibrio sp. POLY-S9]|uniref:DUF4158 domain-containing protein n=1 Tax=Pseudovibrio sp. POLY-S9 TaxID=1576596 RepID=UPI0007099B64|nr:DUF4158 domain-containing protein [Pseudovibrio sp. POLY-S9]
MRNINEASLSQSWSLSYSDTAFLSDLPVSVRLEAAAQLKFVCLTGYFASSWEEINREALSYLRVQLDCPASEHLFRDFSDRTARRYRMQIVGYLGLRRIGPKDRELLFDWIKSKLSPHGHPTRTLVEASFHWCRDQKLQPPAQRELERVVRSANREFQEEFLLGIAGQLSQDAIVQMEASLAEPEAQTGFSRLKDDIGAATLDVILAATERLQFAEGLQLPEHVLQEVERSFIDRIVRRVSAEPASQMRRHSFERRLGLFALYLMVRKSQMIDRVIDLLVEQIHRINAKSKRKVIRDISREIEKVHGKERLLAEIAVASIEQPEGRICDVIYPVAGQQKLSAIIKEYRSKGALDRQIQFVMRGSYASHYRRMLPPLLSVLELRSNNEAWRPVLDGLAWIEELQKWGRLGLSDKSYAKGSEFSVMYDR